MNKITIAICLAVLLTALSSCQPATSKSGTTPSGFKYEVRNDVDGAEPNKGDWVSFGYAVVGDNGKVLQEIWEGDNLPTLQIPLDDTPMPPRGNPILEILHTASVGDSFSVIMPVDSLGGPNPMLEGMNHVEYLVKVNSIETESERNTRVETQRLAAEKIAVGLKAREGDVAAMVAKTLKDYKSGKVKATEKNGLDIIIHEEGTGKTVEDGTRAAMQYYGVLASNGEEFDNSFKAGRPFTFTVGRGEVIAGWDKGLPGLKKGGKATLIIPFDMAYGEAGRPGIPAKSDLVFYVEVEDVN